MKFSLPISYKLVDLFCKKRTRNGASYKSILPFNLSLFNFMDFSNSLELRAITGERANLRVLAGVCEFH